MCAEISLGDDIKPLPDVFEVSVGDDTKLNNNFKASSNERKKSCRKSVTSYNVLDAADDISTRSATEHSHASLKNKQIPAHHLISYQKRDAIKEILPNALEAPSVVATHPTLPPKKRKTKQKNINNVLL